MLVKFHSDKLISHTGFRAQYTAGQSLYLNSSAEILSWGLGFISYNLNLYTWVKFAVSCSSFLLGLSYRVLRFPLQVVQVRTVSLLKIFRNISVPRKGKH